MWIDGVQNSYFTEANRAAGSWSGGGDGTYLNQSADGSEGTGTSLPSSGTWPTMSETNVADGNWGDLTIYENQSVSV